MNDRISRFDLKNLFGLVRNGNVERIRMRLQTVFLFKERVELHSGFFLV